MLERSCQAPQALSLMVEVVPPSYSHTRKGPVLEERSGSSARRGSVGASLPPALQDRGGSSAIQARSARVRWMLPEDRWESSRLFSATLGENWCEMYTADRRTARGATVCHPIRTDSLARSDTLRFWAYHL